MSLLIASETSHIAVVLCIRCGDVVRRRGYAVFPFKVRLPSWRLCSASVSSMVAPVTAVVSSYSLTRRFVVSIRVSITLLKAVLNSYC